MTDTKIFHDIIQKHRTVLLAQIEKRRQVMKSDDISHYILFSALGIEPQETVKIDLYQNVGRFVYRHAGTLLEKLASTAIYKAKGGNPIKLTNNISSNPKTFGIDCYVASDNKAHEIKWRDATTDGDHIRKEHEKLMSIVKHGMIPVRVMFYYPQRKQAQKIQDRILTLFKEHGEAYIERDAWEYIKTYTGYDLLSIITSEADLS